MIPIYVNPLTTLRLGFFPIPIHQYQDFMSYQYQYHTYTGIRNKYLLLVFVLKSGIGGTLILFKNYTSKFFGLVVCVCDENACTGGGGPNFGKHYDVIVEQYPTTSYVSAKLRKPDTY